MAPTALALAQEKSESQFKSQRRSHQARAERGASTQSSANFDSQASAALKGYVEIREAKAVTQKEFNKALGEKIENKSGFIIYKATQTTSTLRAFDPRSRPIVRKTGSPISRIVTGDIIVQFKNHPSNIEAFAREYKIKTKADFKHLSTAIFSSVIYPVDLLQLIDELKSNGDVRSVQLEILGPQLKTQ